MKRLEEERLRALEEAEAVKEMTLESDTAIQNLSKVRDSIGRSRPGEGEGLLGSLMKWFSTHYNYVFPLPPPPLPSPLPPPGVGISSC